MKYHFEDGADGKPQAVLPGAERVQTSTLAKLAAKAPLRPKAAQRPCDIGLFSDEADQADMFAHRA